MKQLENDPWETTIPDKYRPGTIVTGQVTKITNFGVFVQLEPELEGLLHISELSDDKIENAEEVVKVDEEIEVRILRVDIEDRKIGLSRKLEGDLEEIEQEAAAATGGGAAAASTAKPDGSRAVSEPLLGGTGGGAGPLFQMPIGGEQPVAPEADASEAVEAATDDAAEADTSEVEAPETDSSETAEVATDEAAEPEVAETPAEVVEEAAESAAEEASSDSDEDDANITQS